MSRWKYKSDTVIVGENSQKVRQLTAGERREFALASKKIGKGEGEAADLPVMIAKFGCIDPTLSDDDAKSMPSDLLTACVDRIMELTGLRTDDEDKGEKKAPDSSPTTSSSAVA